MKSFVLMTAFLIGLSAHAQPDPQITYAKRQIKLAGKTLTVEIADTPERQRQGLMFRKELAANAGMLFVFDSEAPRGFWMKNTLIPLAIGYFDANKRLINVMEMTPAVMGARDSLLKTYESSKPAMYALEMNKGWFAKNKIQPGARFEFIQ